MFFVRLEIKFHEEIPKIPEITNYKLLQNTVLQYSVVNTF